MATGNSIGKNKTKILQAGSAVALAGLCVTGVASGVACPILMGAAGTLAFSALRRKEEKDCAACEAPVTGPASGNPVSKTVGHPSAYTAGKA